MKKLIQALLRALFLYLNVIAIVAVLALSIYRYAVSTIDLVSFISIILLVIIALLVLALKINADALAASKEQQNTEQLSRP